MVNGLNNHKSSLDVDATSSPSREIRVRGRQEAFDLGDNTVLSNGCLTKNARLPGDIEEGDIIAILDAGAYGHSMHSSWLNRPKPKEIFVDGTDAKDVTEYIIPPKR